MYWKRRKNSDGNVTPDEHALLEKYVHVRRGVFAWLVAMAFLSPFGMSAAGFIYTNHVRHEMEVQQCATLNAIDYPGRQVDTGPSAEVIQNIREQRQRFGCEKK